MGIHNIKKYLVYCNNISLHPRIKVYSVRIKILIKGFKTVIELKFVVKFVYAAGAFAYHITSACDFRSLIAAHV